MKRHNHACACSSESRASARAGAVAPFRVAGSGPVSRSMLNQHPAIMLSQRPAIRRNVAHPIARLFGGLYAVTAFRLFAVIAQVPPVVGPGRLRAAHMLRRKDGFE